MKNTFEAFDNPVILLLTSNIINQGAYQNNRMKTSTKLSFPDIFFPQISAKK
jgi:hypothetical protein